MNKKKYRIAFESKLYNASETMKILKKCPPDIFFKLYHKYRKELDSSMSNRSNTSLNQRLDRLESIVKDGFKELRRDIKDIKQDVKGINTRLDYVVKANNLKDIPDKGR